MTLDWALSVRWNFFFFALEPISWPTDMAHPMDRAHEKRSASFNSLFFFLKSCSFVLSFISSFIRPPPHYHHPVLPRVSYFFGSSMESRSSGLRFLARVTVTVLCILFGSLVFRVWKRDVHLPLSPLPLWPTLIVRLEIFERHCETHIWLSEMAHCLWQIL